MQFYHITQCHRCCKFWGSVQLACWLQNVHQSCCLYFTTISCLQPQTTFNHTSAQDLHIRLLHLQDHLRPATQTADATADLRKQSISATKSPRGTNLHGHCPHQGLDESWFSLYWADVWRCVGERCANANTVNRVSHGGSGVMEWAGISYGQWTQVHFIDGNLNAQRYGDEIWCPLSCHSSAAITSCCSTIMHGSMLQGSEQFLDVENVPVPAQSAYSPNMSPIEHVLDALDWRVRQRGPIPAKPSRISATWCSTTRLQVHEVTRMSIAIFFREREREIRERLY